VGIDNIDLRYAGQASLGNTQMIYGFTLHNNPTIQDLWNTTPGWSFPFLTSEGAPTGLAATLIDGELEQNVLGLGSYAMIGNTVYGEFSVYRSAQQGTAAPTTGAIHGAAPYWRFALQKDWDSYYLMLGTYGLHVSAFPDVLSGPRDSYTDVGVDAQFEAKVGRGNIVGRGTLIHESAKLDGTFALGGSANTKDKLNTLRLSASWYPRQLIGLTGAFFQTTGTNDPVRYAPGAVDGSASGDPETRGFTVELDVNPWENTRLGAQFTAYNRFNGGSTNYDGSGRKASDNNTLFLYTWIAF